MQNLAKNNCLYWGVYYTDADLMMDLVLVDIEWHVHVGISYTPPAALGFINNAAP